MSVACLVEHEQRSVHGTQVVALACRIRLLENNHFLSVRVRAVYEARLPRCFALVDIYLTLQFALRPATSMECRAIWRIVRGGGGWYDMCLSLLGLSISKGANDDAIAKCRSILSQASANARRSASDGAARRLYW